MAIRDNICEYMSEYGEFMRIQGVLNYNLKYGPDIYITDAVRYSKSNSI